MRAIFGYQYVKRYGGRNKLHGRMSKLGGNWLPIGYQLAPNWHPIGHDSRLSGSNRGEGISKSKFNCYLTCVSINKF